MSYIDDKIKEQRQKEERLTPAVVEERLSEVLFQLAKSYIDIAITENRKSVAIGLYQSSYGDGVSPIEYSEFIKNDCRVSLGQEILVNAFRDENQSLNINYNDILDFHNKINERVIVSLTEQKINGLGVKQVKVHFDPMPGKKAVEKGILNKKTIYVDDNTMRLFLVHIKAVW